MKILTREEHPDVPNTEYITGIVEITISVKDSDDDIDIENDINLYLDDIKDDIVETLIEKRRR